MPTTEAGKRLLDEWNATTEAADREWVIDAIEVEARSDANARLSAAHQAGIEVGRNEERERIRAAVEGLRWPYHPDSVLTNDTVSRDAVLAIIDGKEQA